MRRSQVDLEAEVARLRGELWSVRTALTTMASRDFLDLFHGIFSCKSREGAYDWFRFAVEKTLERVKPRQAQEMGDVSYNGPRAYCPMCGGSADNIHHIQGFAYPEGLRRHLEGSYNARHCDVMKAALDLACEAAETAQRRARPVGPSEAARKRSAPQSKR